MTWMVQDEVVHEYPHLFQRTIVAFPEHFHVEKSANLVRAKRWWTQRHLYCTEVGEVHDAPPISCSCSRIGRHKQLQTKVAPGRGHKRSEWVMWLYLRLVAAFESYKRSGVKFSCRLLIKLANSILLGPESLYTIHSRDPKDDILLTQKLAHNWGQQFMHMQNIVLLSQTGRPTCSPQKEIQIERNTVHHLGVLKRSFDSGLFDENLMENIDETHFVVNMDNGRTLGFRDDISTKYAKVISGGDSMTLVVRISGGHRSMIKAPMLIFTNLNSNYPIRGLNDNIPRMSYRIGSKGWMDQNLFANFFEEPRAFQPDLHGHTKLIWTGHNLNPRLQGVLQTKQSILRYLPPCLTHLC